MPSDLVIEDLSGPFVGPIDLVVPMGTCAVVAGPSGAGKSQLLRMIADLDPHEGTVRLGVRSRATMAAPAWRSQVIYVAAETGWWARDVRDHFPETTRARATALADRLGVAEPFGRAVASLSTGEKQRLALVRALARAPSVLLLDEPTSSLDTASIERVEAFLGETLAAGTIILLVSHDPQQGGRLGAARYTMDAGRLVPA